MSTSYRILCLSHDPAIILEPNWAGFDQALAAATDPAKHVEIANHAECDLLVGTWRGGLFLITCPPRPHPREDGHHRLPVGGDIDWLRLLSAAYQAELPDPRLTAALKRLPECWSAERVYRLRHLLQPAPVAEPIAV